MNVREIITEYNRLYERVGSVLKNPTKFSRDDMIERWKEYTTFLDKEVKFLDKKNK